MNTTISIGYNASSFGRKMRLMNAFQNAGSKCDSNLAGLQKKVAGLSDSEGELTIVWAELPKADEIDAFHEAWTSVGEKGDCVTHVWLGMPEKPIAKSPTANSAALSALCKKMAEIYYQEYLQDKEHARKRTESAELATDIERKTAYEPEWNAMQSEYLQLINDKA